MMNYKAWCVDNETADDAIEFLSMYVCGGAVVAEAWAERYDTGGDHPLSKGGEVIIQVEGAGRIERFKVGAEHSTSYWCRRVPLETL